MTFYTSATGAGWIVPKKYVEKVGDEGFKKAPIGAGPYKFVSFTPGVELTLEAFDQYWRKTPSVKRLVFKVIPDESTRLAALKRGEVDIAYSIRGELAEELAAHARASRSSRPCIQAPFWLYFPDQWDPKSPWHDQRVRLAASLAIDRKGINQALTLGHSKLTGSIIPDTFEYFWQPPAPAYDPAKAKKLLAEAGYPNGFDAGDYYCDISYANLAEAVLNNLQAVGIRAKLRPLERAAFFKGYAEKSYKNLIQGGSGAFGNAATRLEAFVVKGGAYVYGSYPDIDALFQEQAAELDRKKREAIAAQDPAAHARARDLRADLAAGLHQRRRPAGRRVGARPDRRPRLLGALRGRDAQERSKIAARRSGSRGRHDALHRSRRLGYSLLSLFLLSLTIFLFVRVTGDPTDAAGGAGRQPGRHRRHPPALRPRSAALGAVLELHGEPRCRATSASPSTTARRCSSSTSRACRTRCCWRWPPWPSRC